ncbi:unnamed protein product [Prorocentrum cordatum]|uniref:Uncharacterized protein n=1 Tax=Prorocentrum cordatum TaxID=2364126 RepID=A0ABN9Y0W6_9DINO|nr:unnamed protein product [Polarella glacialis]
MSSAPPSLQPADDALLQFMAEGGANERLGNGLQQVMLIQSLVDEEQLRREAGDGRDWAENDLEGRALDACQRLHCAIERFSSAGDLEAQLGGPPYVAHAPLVLDFPTRQISKSSGTLQEIFAKDLCALLALPEWHGAFVETASLAPRLSDEARYTLASTGISPTLGGSSRSDCCGVAAPTERLGEAHREHAKDIVDAALKQASECLVESGARIVILGDRGSGKSSCVNAAFGIPVAAAGAGRSITDGISLY